jgi:[ribosomal protein S18]-alanine N-acetyltransferase
MSGNALVSPQIRRATRVDIPDLERLVHESAADHWTVEQITAEFDRAASTLYVASCELSACGFAVVMRAAQEADLLLIAIHPDFRRRGIAAGLLRFIQSDASSSGIDKLCLEVRSTNDGAIALYRQAGFVVAGIRKGYYERDGEDALVMTHELPD